MAKVKYPLTDEAKEAIKYLTEAWNAHKLDQTFYLIDVTTIGTRSVELMPGLGADDSFEAPPLGVLRELAEYHLISLERVLTDRTGRFEITLLQELRNAVANDFEVSDFFLTTQAVGTIINAAENSSVLIPALQSAASVFGDVEQTQINTVSELVTKLVEALGKDTLDSNPDLANAIQELSAADEPQRKLKLGNVIMQLGRSFSYIANASKVIEIIFLLARLFH